MNTSNARLRLFQIVIIRPERETRRVLLRLPAAVVVDVIVEVAVDVVVDVVVQKIGTTEIHIHAHRHRDRLVV